MARHHHLRNTSSTTTTSVTVAHRGTINLGIGNALTTCHSSLMRYIHSIPHHDSQIFIYIVFRCALLMHLSETLWKCNYILLLSNHTQGQVSNTPREHPHRAVLSPNAERKHTGWNWNCSDELALLPSVKSQSLESHDGSCGLEGELSDGVDLEVPMRGLLESRPSRDEVDDTTSWVMPTRCHMGPVPVNGDARLGSFLWAAVGFLGAMEWSVAECARAPPMLALGDGLYCTQYHKRHIIQACCLLFYLLLYSSGCIVFYNISRAGRGA